MKLPTLENSLNETSKFTEEIDPSLSNAVDNASPALAAVNNLKNVDPSTRADVGGKFGAGIGLALNGPVGMLIGSAVGAVAGRATGMVQSGAHDENVRIGKVAQTLSNMGILGEDLKIRYGQKDKAMFLYPPGIKLKNMQTSTITGTKERLPTEIDKSNPFTRRTNLVARPLAHFIAKGLMDWNNPKNPQDKKSVDNIAGMLTNSFQENADSVEIPYKRAKALVKKLGVNEDKMRTFFHNVKAQIPDDEAEDISKGLDILYA